MHNYYHLEKLSWHTKQQSFCIAMQIITKISEEFNQTIHSIASQINRDFDVTLLGEVDTSTREIFNNRSVKVHGIDTKDKTYPEILNEATQKSNAVYFLYIDNRNNPVVLRKAALEAFLISAVRNQASLSSYWQG